MHSKSKDHEKAVDHEKAGDDAATNRPLNRPVDENRSKLQLWQGGLEMPFVDVFVRDGVDRPRSVDDTGHCVCLPVRCGGFFLLGAVASFLSVLVSHMSLGYHKRKLVDR